MDGVERGISRRQFLAGIGVGSGLALAASALPARAAETAPAVIRLGSGAVGNSLGKPISGGVPGWVSSQQYVEKEFAADGIRIEWTHIASAGPGVNEALASNSIDFGYCGDFPGIIGHAGGVGNRLIVPGQRTLSASLVVPLESTATGLKDLVGKRLAIRRGVPAELAFSRLLVESGLTEDQFQLFNLSDSDAHPALLSGGLDGIFGSDSVIVGLKHQAKTVWTTRDLPLPWSSSSDLFVAESFLAKYPETVRRVVKAFIRAAYAASLPENRETVLRSWAKASVPYEVLVQDYKKIDLAQSIVPLADPYLYQHYRDAIDYMVKAKLIPQAFPVESLITPEPARSVLAELGWQTHWVAMGPDGKPAIL